MHRLDLDPHQQKLILRKLLSVFEKDAVLEFFKVCVEKHGDEILLSASGSRSGREVMASAQGSDFTELAQSVREQLLSQLPMNHEMQRFSDKMYASSEASEQAAAAL